MSFLLRRALPHSRSCLSIPNRLGLGSHPVFNHLRPPIRDYNNTPTIRSTHPTFRKMSSSSDTTATAAATATATAAAVAAVAMVEQAKKAAAEQAVADHFDPTFRLVGVGSGTTIRYVVDAIARAVRRHVAEQTTTGTTTTGTTAAGTVAEPGFVPTSVESRRLIVDAGLKVVEIDEVEDVVAAMTTMNTTTTAATTGKSPFLPIEVAFDGADEVDEDLNCIKGGGACLFREKLVVQMAKKFVCVADYRKAQPRLLTNWKTIPIEVAPMAVRSVITRLKTELGSTNPAVRLVATAPTAEPQPLLTDQGFFIVDAPFENQLDVAADGKPADSAYAPAELGRRIRLIDGVLDVGLFAGIDGDEAVAAAANESMANGPRQRPQKPVVAYFGMSDGSVSVRRKK